MAKTEELAKRERWKNENIRRKHNYVPLIFELLKQMAAKGKLSEYIEKGKEKHKERVEKEKERKKKLSDAKKEESKKGEAKKEEDKW